MVFWLKFGSFASLTWWENSGGFLAAASALLEPLHLRLSRVKGEAFGFSSMSSMRLQGSVLR